jgi:hypothetical protein
LRIYLDEDTASLQLIARLRAARQRILDDYDFRGVVLEHYLRRVFDRAREVGTAAGWRDRYRVATALTAGDATSP